MRLQSLVALVTGGSRGLGRAVAHRLAAEGASVMVADLDGSAAGAASPGRLEFHATDVRDEASVRAAVDRTVERFGGLDVLVNNAAVFTALARRPLTDLTAADWDGVFAVNVVGAFHAIKCAVGPMKERGGGRIVNVASNAVFKGLPMLLHYVASKGALVAMTRAAAAELGRYRITVNAVAPGYLRHDDFPGWDPRRDDEVASRRALAATETPDDVVGAVAFLASPDAGFITGQTLVVDGGEVYR